MERSTGLTVLSILSGIWITLTLFNVSAAMANGQLDEVEMEDQKESILEMYSEEDVELMGTMLTDVFDFAIVMNEQLFLINGILLIGSLIGLLGVIMMFRMNRTGFTLYLIYTLIPIALAIIFYPTLPMIFFLVYHIIVGGLFCLLYRNQVKKMV